VKPPFDIAGDLDTPVSAFAKLAAFDPRFLLESVEGGERLARYSFIGFGKCLEVKLDEDGLRVGAATLPRPKDRTGLLDALRKALAAAPKPLPEMAGVPLAGGLVGYSSYDVVRYFERLPAKARADRPVPDLHYVAPESMLVFDHLTRGIALLHAGTEAERQALRREVIRALRGGLPNHSPLNDGAARYTPAEGSLSRDEYIAGVRRTQEYIAAGDVYQLVLSSRFHGRHSLDPFEAYRALRLINPSPYMYYCRLGDITVVGSSPEALVKVDAAGGAQLRPIAGTRPRGETRDADERLALELASDPKELAEHVMLLDLGRNDVGHVSTIGSVRVTEQMAIERYSHVMHIVSNVVGSLPAGTTSFDVLAASFPAGTVSGAPKVRAMEIIDELERSPRGVYAGAVGYISFQDDMDLAIAIRTAVVRDGTLYVQAGAGIVHDSVPETEWQETLNKARAVLRAAELVQLGLDADS
jgi:anthranilate synthase component 1